MDELEFKKQYIKYFPTIFRLAFKYLGNAQDAEDIMQEVYLRLWNNRDSLPQIDNMEAYLVTILKHMLVDSLRNAHSSITLLPDDESKHPPIISDDDVGQKLEKQEEAEIVMDMIRKLPDKERKIVEMRTLEDKSYKEIETQTGLSQPYIRKIISRSREKLKTMFNSQQQIRK